MTTDRQTFEQQFWDAYERLAEQGTCDSPGGMEYRRVFKEWQAFGRPADIESFIAVSANWHPFGPGREQWN